MTNLGKVKGIGPTTAEKLKNAGFETVSLLAAADYNDIIEQVALAPSVTQRLVTAAREIVEVELKEIKGVGPAIAKKLRIAGYTMVSSIAEATKKELVGNLDLIPAAADKLINAAKERIIENKKGSLEHKMEENNDQNYEKEETISRNKNKEVKSKSRIDQPKVYLKAKNMKKSINPKIMNGVNSGDDLINQVTTINRQKSENNKGTDKTLSSKAMEELIHGDKNEIIYASLKDEILIRFINTPHLRKKIVEKVVNGLFS